ncbi:MAG: hypothetical protein J6Y64_06345 [Ruminococcus sp.]|nr:hypothetical protein [Ruminococcus sp.]
MKDDIDTKIITEEKTINKEPSKRMKIVYFISWLPFTAIFLISVFFSFAGFDFLGYILYGLDAFFASMLLLTFIGSIVAVIPLCLIFHICWHLWYNTSFSQRHSKRCLIIGGASAAAVIVLLILLFFVLT